MKEKVWLVDGEKLTIKEMAENVSAEYAKKVMNDEEFNEFVVLQNAFLARKQDEQKEFADACYFPGCYGDALDDC